MKKTIYNFCMVVFEVTLPLFLIMGAILVFGQLIGALMGNGAFVKGINDALKTYSVWVAQYMRILGIYHELYQRKKEMIEGVSVYGN